MLKIVEFETTDGMKIFPIESDRRYEDEAKLLLDVPNLFVLHEAHRDPEPEDDLEEMLDHQYGCFIEFADQHRWIISDEQFNAGIDLYCKTLEALP